ncbi:MAG: glyoxalase [Hyphomonadaceae bacterium]|nr:glyoxalase [Hyphomonadaceae bacterium]OUX93330.1 MAG: glyoxalase [Hyphomonas sp. TMED17]CAI8360949.1 MAG: Uncharacterised protein [Hyphomonas sp. TMED17]
MSVFPEQRFSIMTIGVKDLSAMRSFYSDTLGFRDTGPKEMAMFDMGGFVLGLWEADKLAADIGNDAPANSGSKPFALAYNARSIAEVDKIFANCEAAGVKITTLPHKAFWGGYSGYFVDPEGNAWEVAYNPFWSFDEAGREVLPKEAN